MAGVPCTVAVKKRQGVGEGSAVWGAAYSTAPWANATASAIVAKRHREGEFDKMGTVESGDMVRSGGGRHRSGVSGVGAV